MVRQHDYFGNPVVLFTIQEPHKKLEITARHRIEITSPTIEVASNVSWEAARAALQSDRTHLDARQFVFDSHYVQQSAALLEYATPSFAPGRLLLDAVADLTARIHREFRYDDKATTLATPLADVVTKRKTFAPRLLALAERMAL